MRYWAVEHVSLMLIALAMVHVGRSRSRKGATSAAKHRSAAIFYTLALAAILAAIPWPFLPQGRPLLPGSELGSTLASCTSVAWGAASGKPANREHR